jgi:hypothetical protein
MPRDSSTALGMTEAGIVFWCSYAYVSACHGSPKTQNIKDAIAHAESGKPLARLAAKQMSRSAEAACRRISPAHRAAITAAARS